MMDERYFEKAMWDMGLCSGADEIIPALKRIALDARIEQARVDRGAFEGAYLEAGQEYGLSADRVYCLTSRALAAVAPEAK